MLKQLLPISIIVLGIIASVFLIQTGTQLQSKAYELLEFIPAFNSSENDPRYKSNLDVNKDGTINVFDVINDRYQMATRSATQSAEATKSAEASASAKVSSTPIPTPTPSPTPTPQPVAENEYNRILNSQGNSNFK